MLPLLRPEPSSLTIENLFKIFCKHYKNGGTKAVVCIHCVSKPMVSECNKLVGSSFEEHVLREALVANIRFQ